MQIQKSETGVLALPSGENVWREAWRQKDMDPSGNQKQSILARAQYRRKAGWWPAREILQCQSENHVLNAADAGSYWRPAAAAKSLQSCPTPCNPMDCSPPGSSAHGIFQARVLEWGAIAFSDWRPAGNAFCVWLSNKLRVAFLLFG